MTDDEAAVRRARILTAARWCFLNFGFAKTAFEDIAKRANLSRTLLYRIFKDKEEIYQAVFVDWLVSRHPAAKQAAKGPGSPYERLLSVCRLMALEPWAEMVGTPMGREFLEVCERIDPESEALYRKVVHECVAAILGDEASAEVFLLALDGLFADQPSMEVLEQTDAAPRSALRSSLVEERSAVMTASPEIQEIVIITGASSGIGAATARELARRGFHVLAGVRRDQDADAIRGPGIEPLIIDITNPDHIRALATRVHGDPQGRAVRALVNNAGIGVNAPVEVFAIDEWRRLFEVNFFGHIAVTQTLLPALIRSKGRVINISSVGGKIAMATYGPYAGTKFALEAVSDSLRRESRSARRPGGRGRTGRCAYENCAAGRSPEPIRWRRP